MAASQGRGTVVTLLIDRGADVDLKNEVSNIVGIEELDLSWLDLTWFDMMRYDMIWNDMIG